MQVALQSAAPGAAKPVPVARMRLMTSVAAAWAAQGFPDEDLIDRVVAGSRSLPEGSRLSLFQNVLGLLSSVSSSSHIQMIWHRWLRALLSCIGQQLFRHDGPHLTFIARILFLHAQSAPSAIPVQVTSLQHVCTALLQEAGMEGLPEEGRAAALALATAIASQASLPPPPPRGNSDTFPEWQQCWRCISLASMAFAHLTGSG